MGGLKTAFIHNGVRRQSSFIPWCPKDYKSQRADSEEAEGDYRTEREGCAGRTYWKKILHHTLKYFADTLPQVLPKRAHRGRESNIRTLLVLLESQNGLKMSEQTSTTLSDFLSLAVSFFFQDGP